MDDAEDTFTGALSRLDAVKRELQTDHRAAGEEAQRRGWQAVDAKRALDGWIAARWEGAGGTDAPAGPRSEPDSVGPRPADSLEKLAHDSTLSALAAARGRAESLRATARHAEASLDEARDVLRREDAAARCVQRGSAAAAAVEGFNAAVEGLEQERERVLSQGVERAQAAHAATQASAMLKRLQQGLEANEGDGAGGLALSEVPGIRRAMERARTAVQGMYDAARAVKSAMGSPGRNQESTAASHDAETRWRAESSHAEASWQAFENASALSCDTVVVAVSRIEQEVAHREMRARLRRTVVVRAPSAVPFLRSLTRPSGGLLRCQDAEETRRTVATRLDVTRRRLAGLEAAVRVRRRRWPRPPHPSCRSQLVPNTCRWLCDAVQAATEGGEVADGPRVAAALTKGRTAHASASRACEDLGVALTHVQSRPKAQGKGEMQVAVSAEPADRMQQCKQAADQASRAVALAEARLREVELTLEEETVRCVPSPPFPPPGCLLTLLPAVGNGALAEIDTKGTCDGLGGKASQGASVIVCERVRSTTQPAVPPLVQPVDAFKWCSATSAPRFHAHSEGATSTGGGEFGGRK